MYSTFLGEIMSTIHKYINKEIVCKIKLEQLPLLFLIYNYFKHLHNSHHSS